MSRCTWLLGLSWLSPISSAKKASFPHHTSAQAHTHACSHGAPLLLRAGHSSSVNVGLPNSAFSWGMKPDVQVQFLGPKDSPGVGNGNTLQYSCLGNPMDRGACRATVHGVVKSGTWLSDDHFQFIHIWTFWEFAHWQTWGRCIGQTQSQPSRS